MGLIIQLIFFKVEFRIYFCFQGCFMKLFYWPAGFAEESSIFDNAKSMESDSMTSLFLHNVLEINAEL